MRIVAWLGMVYLAGIGAATFASNSMTNSPTLDTIAALPSIGSLFGSSGVTAGALDLGGAAALYFFVLR